jgi:hypothetical protein
MSALWPCSKSAMSCGKQFCILILAYPVSCRCQRTNAPASAPPVPPGLGPAVVAGPVCPVVSSLLGLLVPPTGPELPAGGGWRSGALLWPPLALGCWRELAVRDPSLAAAKQDCYLLCSGSEIIAITAIRIRIRIRVRPDPKLSDFEDQPRIRDCLFQVRIRIPRIGHYPAPPRVRLRIRNYLYIWPLCSGPGLEIIYFGSEIIRSQGLVFIF